jgi:uncharacterized protein involved in type VI secretion and phage assembly
MAKLVDFLGRPHSGIVPYSVIAVVTEVADPDDLARVKVKFVTLPDNPTSFWMRIASPNAGADRGFWSIPEVNDEVLVSFIQGSHDVGVIVGQFWNGKDKYPKEAKAGMPTDTSTGGKVSTAKHTAGDTVYHKDDKIVRRLWRSRTGHLIVLDDSDGKESVQIWDKGHKLSFVMSTKDGLITLANNDKDIHIRAKENIYIEAGKNIKIEAGEMIDAHSVKDTSFKTDMNFAVKATMNFKVEATQNIDMKATMNATVKATMNATVEGAIQVETKGAQAKVTASAMATISGGLVKIN